MIKFAVVSCDIILLMQNGIIVPTFRLTLGLRLVKGSKQGIMGYHGPTLSRFEAPRWGKSGDELAMWLWRWLWWVIAFYGAVYFQEDGGGGVIAVMMVVVKCG